jgi:MFS family permease
MGVAMSGFGITSMLSALILPWLSDRIGRRSAITVGAGLGAVAALLIASSSSTTALLAVIGVGIAGGTFPLFIAAIPSESAPGGRAASWIAVVQGVGEICGGMLGPLITGSIADLYGPRAAVETAAACVCLAAGVSFVLIETNLRTHPI